MKFVLDSTTDSLQAKTAAAATTTAPKYTVAYADKTTSAFTPGEAHGSLTSTLADIAAAPAASTQRIVDSVSIFNADTVSHTITVAVTVSGTAYEAVKQTVAVGATLTIDASGVHVTTGTPTDTSQSKYNYLINGGFDLAQRQAPTTYTSISDTAYGPDRWKCFRENADLQFKRGAIDSGGIANAGYFKKITSAGKILAAQIIESNPVIALRGLSMQAQCQMKMGVSAATMRFAILKWTGTADTLTDAMVTAWGADATDPTFATSYAKITPTAGSNVTVANDGCSCSVVTTGFTEFSFSFTVPSDANNLVLVAFSDSDFAANDELILANAGLYAGAGDREWTPRLPGEELALAQRYYRKSYSVDVIPGTASARGLRCGIAATSDSVFTSGEFSGGMRISPTMVIYSYNGTANKCANISAADVGTSVTCPSTKRTSAGYDSIVDSGGGLTVGSTYIWHYTADAEL